MIFALILLPVALLNLEEHDRDGFVGELIDTSEYSLNTFVEEKPDLGDPIYGEKNNASVENFLS